MSKINATVVNQKCSALRRKSRWPGTSYLPLFLFSSCQQCYLILKKRRVLIFWFICSEWRRENKLKPIHGAAQSFLSFLCSYLLPPDPPTASYRPRSRGGCLSGTDWMNRGSVGGRNLSFTNRLYHSSTVLIVQCALKGYATCSYWSKRKKI